MEILSVCITCVHAPPTSCATPPYATPPYALTSQTSCHCHVTQPLFPRPTPDYQTYDMLCTSSPDLLYVMYLFPKPTVCYIMCPSPDLLYVEYLFPRPTLCYVCYIPLPQTYCMLCTSSPDLLYVMYLFPRPTVCYVPLPQTHCMLCTSSPDLLYVMYLFPRPTVCYAPLPQTYIVKCHFPDQTPPLTSSLPFPQTQSWRA